MKNIVKISTLAFLLCVLCAVAGTTAAGYVFPGGFLSTTTSVSVDGNVSDTVFIKHSTDRDGLTEKNTWESSYVTETPARQSFGTHLSMGAQNGSLWWNFQRTGLPDDPVDIPTPGTSYPFFLKPSLTPFF